MKAVELNLPSVELAVFFAAAEEVMRKVVAMGEAGGMPGLGAEANDVMSRGAALRFEITIGNAGLLGCRLIGIRADGGEVHELFTLEPPPSDKAFQFHSPP